MENYKKNPDFFYPDFLSGHIQLLRLLADVSQNTAIHVEHMSIHGIRSV